jgi:hypothetical protein
MKCDNRLLLEQIGFYNVGAISGGRVIGMENGVILPVGYGYKVIVELNGFDLYNVKRVYVKGAQVYKEWVVENVGSENVGEVAYQASCFKNKQFGEAVAA